MLRAVAELRCPRQELNLRPSAPEADALSPELRGQGRRNLSNGRRRRTNPAPYARCVPGTAATPEQLADAIRRCLAAAVADGDLAPDEVPPEVGVRASAGSARGDFTSPVALQLSARGLDVHGCAEGLAVRLRRVPDVASVEVAGAGHLNVTVHLAALVRAAQAAVPPASGHGPRARTLPAHRSLGGAGRAGRAGRRALGPGPAAGRRPRGPGPRPARHAHRRQRRVPGAVRARPRGFCTRVGRGARRRLAAPASSMARTSPARLVDRCSSPSRPAQEGPRAEPAGRRGWLAGWRRWPRPTSRSTRRGRHFRWGAGPSDRATSRGSGSPRQPGASSRRVWHGSESLRPNASEARLRDPAGGPGGRSQRP